MRMEALMAKTPTPPKLPGKTAPKSAKALGKQPAVPTAPTKGAKAARRARLAGMKL